MAGLTPDGIMTAMLMKALLDMSAFALLGDTNIRIMQQELNRKYNSYFGLLPCDGIYQRETNEALIYALQAEIGMGTATANGYYGAGTTAQTPTLQIGQSGSFVKILQWALYVNGFNASGIFDGKFTQSIGNEVVAFRKFMNLAPYYSSVADMTVIKGLLSSAGNTSRAASACDMATQLTKQQAQTIKNNGFSIVGRYLTGSVGVGANKRDKNLTLTEIKNITDSGLSIFPIYQDGGWDESYFTSEQGNYDGAIAAKTAFSLGFPSGTTIYFAVDVDILDGDIAGTVIPYISKVKEALDYHGMYTVGIYGTRNVCQKAIDSGAVTNCFVSDMSTGFSGNLGFSMPKKWAFDQFFEHENLGFPIDKVAVSGRDTGVKRFNSTSENIIEYEATQLIKKLHWDSLLKDVGVKLDTEYHLSNYPVDIYFTARSSYKIENNKAGFSLIVNNGKVDKIKYSDPIQAELNKYKDTLKLQGNEQVEQIINELAPSIGNGFIETGVCARNNKIGLKLTIRKEIATEINGRIIKSQLEITAEIYLESLEPSPIPDYKYKEIYNDITEGTSVIDWSRVKDGLITVAGFTIVAIGIIALLIYAPLGGAAAAFLLFLSLI